MKITVFTPTYNRDYIIENLYKSLQRQTFSDFEWLVVDDGSTDNTKELFEEWKKENNNFDIRYYKKENGGKHRAINYALDRVKGELFFVVDSDDYLTDNALTIIASLHLKIPKNDEIVGIAGRKKSNICINEKKDLIYGTSFKGNYLDIKYHERNKYNITGEKAIIYYSKIIKNYRFPEIDNEKFMNEAVIQNMISSKGYKLRWVNKVFQICEYMDDGLTKKVHELYLSSPKGYIYWLNQEAELDKVSKKFKEKIKLNYYYEFKNILSKKQICENLEIKTYHLEVLILIHCIFKYIKTFKR